jgi:hypothetical protein
MVAEAIAGQASARISKQPAEPISPGAYPGPGLIKIPEALR